MKDGQFIEDRQALEEFLEKLTELSQKYGICIATAALYELKRGRGPNGEPHTEGSRYGVEGEDFLQFY